jgi:hypothetical protein
MNLEIFSSTGQLAWSHHIGKDLLYSGTVRLDPGAYMVRVTGDKGVKVTKIIIQ